MIELHNQESLSNIWCCICQSGNILKCSILEILELLVFSNNGGDSNLLSPKWKYDVVNQNMNHVLINLNHILDLTNKSQVFTTDVISCYSQYLDSLDISLHELLESISYLSELLTYEVITPFKNQLMDYHMIVTKQKNYFFSLLEKNNDYHNQISSSQDEHTCFNYLSDLIDECLITVQNLKHFTNDYNLISQNKGYFQETITFPTNKVDDDDGKEDDLKESENNFSTLLPLNSCLSLMLKSFSLIKITSITSTLTKIYDYLKLESRNVDSVYKSNLCSLIKQILPIVDGILSLCLIYVEDMFVSYKSTGKLLYICLRTFRVLLSKGFCFDQTKDGEGY